MPLRRNVLLFHQAALGDFIITWPIALALARIHPQSRIIYITHGQKGALAESALRVESANAELGWHTLLAAGQPPPPNVGKTLENTHTVLSFHGGDDRFAEALKRGAPHLNVISINTRSEDKPRHVSDELIAQLAPHPALASAAEQMMRSVAARGVGARLNPVAGRLVVHPGAGKVSHCWPIERYIDVLRHFTDPNQRPRVLIGEVERERWTSPQIDALRAAAEVIEPSTLVELLAEIASAGVFLGNDSGPAHLAGIIGVPTVALYGAASDPLRWRPLGPRVQVVSGVELADITADVVCAHIHTFIGP